MISGQTPLFKKIKYTGKFSRFFLPGAYKASLLSIKALRLLHDIYKSKSIFRNLTSMVITNLRSYVHLQYKIKIVQI